MDLAIYNSNTSSRILGRVLMRVKHKNHGGLEGTYQVETFHSPLIRQEGWARDKHLILLKKK